MLLAAALRCFGLGGQSLWIDEVLTWMSAGGTGPFGWTELRENVHGPLFSLILHGWMRIAGDAEWALRLPSAMFGILTVPAMAWLARESLGRDVGVAAAWIAAGSPFLQWYGQEARNYSLLILCACVSTALLLRILRCPGAGATWGYLLATAAGMLSNLSFAFLAPLHLWAWIGPREGRSARLTRAALILAGLALVAAPWAMEAWRVWDWNRLHPARETPLREMPLRGQTTFHAGAAPFAAYALSVGYSFGPSLRELRSGGPLVAAREHAPAIAVAAIVCGALVWIGLRETRRRGRLTFMLIWLLVPVLVVSYMAIQNFKVFHPRYVAVAAPAWLLLFAAAFAALRPRGRWLAGLALGAIWGLSLWNLAFDPRYFREDYRGAAAMIRARAQAGEQVLAVYSHEPMEYYMRGAMPVRPLWLGLVADPERLDAALDQALAGASGTWIVLSREEDLDPEGVFARRLETRYPDAERLEATGVTLWRWAPRAGAVE
jgi:uncharacterized membrane protein